ncbi:MAG: biopolymer transporter ExbD [Myxococcota bacterium]|jgi:biopolymer transport protein ExbD|nr:biopolymer transporter ExbD [Myxococcota bacterium]
MGIQLEGGKGGRRSLNSEINLIPMIDLLIVSISFLLITAVWTQLSRLNVMQQMPGQPNTEEPQEEKVRLFLKVNGEGFELNAGDVVKIPKKGQEYDFEKLRTELAKVRENFADRHDMIVAPEDGVKYVDIITSMDIAIQHEFAALSMADGSSL